MKTVGELLSFLENVPEKYRRGDWHPACVILLYCFVSALALSLGSAVKDFESSSKLLAIAEEPAWLQSYRMGLGVYGVAVLTVVVTYTGAWTLTSYTITSWNLLWIRLLSAYVDRLYGGSSPLWAVVSRSVKYPALIGNFITVVVWWGMLVPLIYGLIQTKEGKRGFMLFNVSPLLLNIHFLNLPLAVVEYIYSAKPLTLFDLWSGYVVVFAYVMFYLNYLDKKGWQFYIVFTPRTVFVLLTYPLVLSLYYVNFTHFNSFLRYVHGA